MISVYPYILAAGILILGNFLIISVGFLLLKVFLEFEYEFLSNKVRRFVCSAMIKR